MINSKSEAEEFVVEAMARYDRCVAEGDTWRIGRSREKQEVSRRNNAKWQYLKQIVKGFAYTVCNKHHDELFDENKELFEDLYDANLYIVAISMAILNVREDYVSQEKFFVDEWFGNVARYDENYIPNLIKAIKNIVVDDANVKQLHQICDNFLDKQKLNSV